ncbi:hypothetical protein Bca52824_006926 [Brassica carinata]|uniref:Uncharacterized protein n=1 Tax=Brassica carinata TaxID=52824 RepID=A0A8X7W5B6_BRACI|nr:hypothetical protein Bca52824_006926 [Brassica carinata]
MEELRDYQKQLRQVKDECNQSEQKLVVVQKTVSELSKKITGVKLMLCVLVLIGLVLFFVRGIASKASYDSYISCHLNNKVQYKDSHGAFCFSSCTIRPPSHQDFHYPSPLLCFLFIRTCSSIFF